MPNLNFESEDSMRSNDEMNKTFVLYPKRTAPKSSRVVTPLDP